MFYSRAVLAINSHNTKPVCPSACEKTPVMLSISTALFALQSEVTALEESRHPERSVLGEVKSLP
jgi:hypothetical protein